MSRFLIFAWALFALSLLATASVAQAASARSSGYVSLAVPDLPQAVAFFRDVLDCEPTGESAPAHDQDGSAPPPHALLLCSAGSVIELVHDAGNRPAASRSVPVQFFADDALHADQWLRHEGVTVVGAPVVSSTGPQAGMVLVNFLTPWGQPMQLVNWNTAGATAIR